MTDRIQHTPLDSHGVSDKSDRATRASHPGWRIIEDYPDYAVSMGGEVYSFISGRQLTPFHMKGYKAVGLRASASIADAAARWWHRLHFCMACDGCGMTGPLDDPDPCPVCGGWGHSPGFDLCREGAIEAYRCHQRALGEASHE